MSHNLRDVTMHLYARLKHWPFSHYTSDPCKFGSDQMNPNLSPYFTPVRKQIKLIWITFNQIKVIWISLDQIKVIWITCAVRKQTAN